MMDYQSGQNPLNLVDGNGYVLLGGSGKSPPGVSTSKPKHPENAVEARRLQTFNTWPLWTLQSPENLAKAVFFMPIPLSAAGAGEITETGIRDESVRSAPDFSAEHSSVQLVRSLGYNLDLIKSAFMRVLSRMPAGTTPKGAQLLEAVLQMEDERRTGGSLASILTDHGGLNNQQGAAGAAPAAPSIAEEFSEPVGQSQTNKVSTTTGVSIQLLVAAAVATARKTEAAVTTVRPLAPLQDIIFTGLMDIPDLGVLQRLKPSNGEERFSMDVRSKQAK